jgi:NMD protein affecting ribosome stability and mRNA decay
VFRKGRWDWAEVPQDAHKELCPACHRVKDRVPAGFLTIRGEFYTQHKDEIMNLIHNTEKKQKAEHPLQRIMGMEDQEEGVIITFTDAHLTRGVGVALHHAYQGELDFQYTDEDIMLRVSWTR